MSILDSLRPIQAAAAESSAPQNPDYTSNDSIPVSEILDRHPASETKKPRKPRADKGVGRGPRTVASQAEQPDVQQPIQMSPLAKEQVTVALKSLINVIDCRICKSIERAATKISGDKNFGVELSDSVKMVETELDTITSLSVIVIEKYNVLGTYAPEALLCCAVLGYGYRVHRATSELKQLAIDLTEQHGLSAQATSATDNGPERNGEN